MSLLMKGYVSATVAHLGSIKQALTASGWIDEEVIAAGELRQGKPLSVAGMVTGTAVIELARRRSKSLPRHFVLAVTAHRVLAFRAFSTGDDSDAQAEAQMIRIRPGECGSWPRAAVRLLDLPDGAQSDTGTLELSGTERVQVTRLNDDPNTDELIHVLGRGASALPTGTAKHRRAVEQRESLRRASDVGAADAAQAAVNAARGRPDFDLTRWAQGHGLEARGAVSQAGYLRVTCPWSEDVLFNVVRGRWPGGTYGVVCHEARMYEDDARGYFRGGEAEGGGQSKAGFLLDSLVPIPLPIGGQGQLYFKVPYTVAGARVPHLATLTGLHVARRAERFTSDDALFGIWRSRDLDDLGLSEPWVAGIRKHSDETIVEALLHGPIRRLLSVQQGLGFEIRIEYGQVILARQDFLTRDDDLDALTAAVEELAREVAAICVPRAGIHDLARRLEPPVWLEAVRRKPKDRHTLWPIGALLERVVQAADARGMTVEDPRSFHRAFPGLNIPGEAFGVLHGPLPGIDAVGRLVCCAERPMVIPDDVRKLLKDPGGPAGCDVAVLAVEARAHPTAPEGELDGGLRFALEGGVLTAWRARRSWQCSGEALDQLAADVGALIRRRGWATQS